ncbi:MAG: hypothetical protein FWF08_00460 [Oscillospiraceae bacterium]|nr:hypothetical protein [Oscillospiraceae bacterium]
MKIIDSLEILLNLFDYKTIPDENGNEFVVYKNSRVDFIENIEDKTAFEAVENHVHILNNVKKNEFERLFPVAENLVKALLNNLKSRFPEKSFCVFATIELHESFIIRFHQKWDNETPYYDPAAFDPSKTKVVMFFS